MGNRQGPDVQRKSQLIQSLHSDGKLITQQDSELRFGELSWTLLHFASWCSNSDLVKRLVELNFDLNAQDIHGNTPLHLAKLQCHEQIYKQLVSLGASTSTPNIQGQSAVSLDCLFSPTTREFPKNLVVITESPDDLVMSDPSPRTDLELESAEMRALLPARSD
jgi:ankyrin repeat protein